VNTDSEYSSKIFITMYHTTWGLKWNCIINSHHFEYLKSCIKKCVDGNVTLGRLHYSRGICFLQTRHLVSHTLSTTCVHSVSYFASQTNWGKNILEYSLVADIISILFYCQEHTWLQSCTKMISEGQSHMQSYILPVSNVLEVDATASIISHLSPREIT
jgi:hypothetical protein